MTKIARLSRGRAIQLLQAALLVEFARLPLGTMSGADIESFFDAYGLDLIPHVDRIEAIDGLVEAGDLGVHLYAAELWRIAEPMSARFEQIKITTAGKDTVHLALENRKSDVSRYWRYGQPWLQERLERVYAVLLDSPLTPPPFPSSIEIRLGEIQTEQRELAAKIDALIALIDSNNSFRQADAENYEAVRASLGELKIEVAKPITTPSRLEQIAWGTLSFLAKKFAEGPIGVAANQLWDFILTVITDHLL